MLLAPGPAPSPLRACLVGPCAPSYSSPPVQPLSGPRGSRVRTREPWRFSSFGLVTNNSRDRAPPPSLPRLVPPPLETRRPTLCPAALPGLTSAADCRYSALTLTPFNLLCRLNTTPREEVLLCPRRSCSLPLSSWRLIVVACDRARSVAASRLPCWTLRSVPAPRRSVQPLPSLSRPGIGPPPLDTRWPTLRPAALPGSTSAADCRYSAPTLTPFNLLCRLNTTPREEVLLCPRRSCSLPLSS